MIYALQISFPYKNFEDCESIERRIVRAISKEIDNAGTDFRTRDLGFEFEGRRAEQKANAAKCAISKLFAKLGLLSKCGTKLIVEEVPSD